MNNFKNLKPREKSLLLIMLSLLFIFFIYIIGANAFSKILSSQNKLESMKLDYEHVLKRYQQIEKSVNSQLTNDKTKLLSSIRDYINSSDVIFLNSNLKNNNLELEVSSNSVETIIQFINDLGKKYNFEILSINIKRASDKFILELVIN
jgi:type II secretory pathway component PulM